MTADHNPTTFSRVAFRDVRDVNTPRTRNEGESYPVQVWTAEVSAGATAGAPVQHVIRGEFEVTEIVTTVLTAVNSSAKNVLVGTSADVSAFVDQTVSAGAANERFTASPASGNLAGWLSTGSAAAVTTVQAYWSDASGLDASGYLTFSYVVKD